MSQCHYAIKQGFCWTVSSASHNVMLEHFLLLSPGSTLATEDQVAACLHMHFLLTQMHIVPVPYISMCIFLNNPRCKLVITLWAIICWILRCMQGKEWVFYLPTSPVASPFHCDECRWWLLPQSNSYGKGMDWQEFKRASCKAWASRALWQNQQYKHGKGTVLVGSPVPTQGWQWPCHTVRYVSGVCPYTMENTNLKSGEFDPMPCLMLSKMANSLKDNNSFPPTQGLTTFYHNYFLSLTPQTSLGP